MPAFVSSDQRKLSGGANTASGFDIAPLTDMAAIGAVTSRSARIWVRSARAGRIRVHYGRLDHEGRNAADVEVATDSGRDGTAVLTLPAAGDERGLEPQTRYAYRAVHAASGQLIGSGEFETAPRDAASAPSDFSIAIMSCNQPFDEDGRPTTAGEEMLQAAALCLEQSEARYVITLGDQMYTDYPQALSLFDTDYFRTVAPRPECRNIRACSAAEVRRLLHERYRAFWSIEGWRALHAHYPCYPILDDHDLVDNWGSVPAHSTREWQNFKAGARAAYQDYQGSRVGAEDELPPDFDYEIEYGPTATYVLDLRSHRSVGETCRIYAPYQMQRLEQFLARHADKEVLMFALSVPPVHLPRWCARLARTLTPMPNEDFSDRWSTAGHIRDRDRLLRLLHDHQRRHPDQRLVLLSGDIHVACVHQIIWDDGTPPLVQFVSSGITNKVSRFTQLAVRLSLKANRRLSLVDSGLKADVRLLEGGRTGDENPYTQLNIGLVELRRDDDNRLKVRFAIYGQQGGAPICAYRSAWL